MLEQADDATLDEADTPVGCATRGLQRESVVREDHRIPGASFSKLRRCAAMRGETVPPAIAVAVLVPTLLRLHAAHEATTSRGAPFRLINPGVSPENILVGVDGVACVLDFGIARGEGQTFPADAGVRGKLAYMAPEQLGCTGIIDRRADLFLAGVMLWEAIAGERLFRGDDAAVTTDAILHRETPRLAKRGLGVPAALDKVLRKSLTKAPSARYCTADEMARALGNAILPASHRQVSEWVMRVAGSTLAERARMVGVFEGSDFDESEEAFAEGDLPSFADEAFDTPAPTLRRASMLLPPQLNSARTERRATLDPRSEHTPAAFEERLLELTQAEDVTLVLARRRAPALESAGPATRMTTAPAPPIGRTNSDCAMPFTSVPALAPVVLGRQRAPWSPWTIAAVALLSLLPPAIAGGAALGPTNTPHALAAAPARFPTSAVPGSNAPLPSSGLAPTEKSPAKDDRDVSNAPKTPLRKAAKSPLKGPRGSRALPGGPAARTLRLGDERR